MRLLVPCLAALSIGCVTSGPATVRATTPAAPEPVASVSTTTTAVEAAAEYAITTYVDEATRTRGMVCVDLASNEDPAPVLGRLTPLASRVSADRKDCLGRDPSAILSIGPSQIAGDRARVDVGVVLGSAGMLELERRDGAWTVVRVTSAWISLR